MDANAPRTIGLIWQILYPIILISFGFVFCNAFRGKVPWLTAPPFIINLIANILFMPIFGGLRNLPLATADILIVAGTIFWMMAAVWPHYRWVAVARDRIDLGQHRHGAATDAHDKDG